jgi:predicted unusual protein kinase regulating ubiquinone biosynthesis (AarF/ABC1/UbiB family)
MEEKVKIPTTKIERATRFARTGMRVGGNYLKYYTKKALNQDPSRLDLHSENAADIYDGLSELKGSALKVLQVLSMDRSLLPAPYVERFAHAQYSAPPLSYPLVVNTFKKFLNASPDELFDSFSRQARFAASIGQVHEATLKGRRLAVKVQYPGVAESVVSDLTIVKPFASRLFNISDKDVDFFFVEVKERLLEETDYSLELSRSQRLSEACKDIPNIVFTRYLPEFSCPRILTMEWLEGMHLDAFVALNPTQEMRDKIGQALWDFYEFQLHSLREVHADPHPGNFLIQSDGTVGVIDFGCVKVLSEQFYYEYFHLLKPGITRDPQAFDKVLRTLHFLHEFDTQDEIDIFTQVFRESIELLGRPFSSPTFDFGEQGYFDEILTFGEKLSKIEAFKRSKVARGPRDALYVSRTFFGLYHLLNHLKARVRITLPEWLLQ